MEQPEFNYKRKPAFISFLPVYIFCFGVSFLLIYNSPEISGEIFSRITARFNISASNPLWNLAYGTVFSIPFLVYGILKILWNIMSLYEFSSSEIRLLTGSLIRKERFFAVPDFFEISFRQNMIETPFGAGSLSLTSIKSGKRLIIKGVYNVRSVVKALRSGLSAAL